MLLSNFFPPQFAPLLIWLKLTKRLGFPAQVGGPLFNLYERKHLNRIDIIYFNTDVMNEITTDYKTFFLRLEQNNSKEWFHENKISYDKFVNQPFDRLMTSIIQEISRADALIENDPKKYIFRINKDMRFVKDNQPYKLFKSALITENGKSAKEKAGFYIELGANYLKLSGGCFKLKSKELQRLKESKKLIEQVLISSAFYLCYKEFKIDSKSATFECTIPFVKVLENDIESLILGHWRSSFDLIKCLRKILNQ